MKHKLVLKLIVLGTFFNSYAFAGCYFSSCGSMIQSEIGSLNSKFSKSIENTKKEFENYNKSLEKLGETKKEENEKLDELLESELILNSKLVLVLNGLKNINKSKVKLIEANAIIGDSSD